jgi:dipeptidyl aminopeptidase/acylaminoacyl peptidase
MMHTVQITAEPHADRPPSARGYRTLAVRLSLLPLLALTACGGGSTEGVRPAAIPQIVFAGPGVPGTVSVQQLYTGNLDASDIVQIQQDNHNKFLAHFSPDGTRLVYSKFLTGKFGDTDPEVDIFTYTFASGTETRLTTTGTSFQPAWSPDGQQIAFGNYACTGLYVMDPDGANQQLIAHPSQRPDDIQWHDVAWSSDDWIYFVVEQTTNSCLKVRLDKIRPDGTSRTQVTDGGPNCTPPDMEPYGDADPGISADGQTVYSSRGLSPLPADPAQTLRHLYAYSSSAYTPGKLETDLSITSKPECTVGVPKGSPDGAQILVFLFCPSDPNHTGVTLTETSGSSWTFIATGFGPDWNPATQL